MVSPSSISKLMGVSDSLMGCPSKRNLMVAMAIPWEDTTHIYIPYIMPRVEVG
jgi:hypothetical protein